MSNEQNTAPPATPQQQALDAANALAGLTPEQRTAVIGVAGSDPAAQLATIAAVRSTWAASAPPATPHLDIVAKLTSENPAAAAVYRNTHGAALAAERETLRAHERGEAPLVTPAGGLPPLEMWERLKVENPAAAGRFYTHRMAEILRAQRAARST